MNIYPGMATLLHRTQQLLQLLPSKFFVILLVAALKLTADKNHHHFAFGFPLFSVVTSFRNDQRPNDNNTNRNNQRIIIDDGTIKRRPQLRITTSCRASTRRSSTSVRKKSFTTTALKKTMMMVMSQGDDDTGGEKVLLKNDDVLLVSDDSNRSSSSNKHGATAPPSIAAGNTCTLAGDYWIECSSSSFRNVAMDEEDDKTITTCYTWTLVPLKRMVRDLDPAFQQSAGATAWAALYSSEDYSNNSNGNDSRSTVDYSLTAATTTVATKRRAAAATISLQSRVSKHDIHSTIQHVTVIVQDKVKNSNKVVTADDDDDDDEAKAVDPLLIAVLARVLVLWTLALEGAKSTTAQVAVAAAAATELRTNIIVHWPDDTTTTLPTAATMKNEECVQLLYQDVYDMTTSRSTKEEVVEMVDRQGLVLGRVPRQLVHQFNLLHRGIGMLVTRDQTLVIPKTATQHDRDSIIRQQQQQNQPDLYVHQRTAAKRIFPSLYDMFVGGVALAGESSQLTARREVAEELGLEQAILLSSDNTSNNRLSDCLWTCTVCTAYNRCVVDFFTYTMDTTTERISWQDEEVVWGDFVPYHIVESAADLSIQRLANENAWPGRYPPLQSQHHAAGAAAAAREKVHDVAGSSATTTMTTTTTSLYNEEWKTWDFVPDGLLVWEAWLQFLTESKK
jgi:8-oxo-dGTP pyrophosphatase MutT (NUDIX family)